VEVMLIGLIAHTVTRLRERGLLNHFSGVIAAQSAVFVPKLLRGITTVFRCFLLTRVTPFKLRLTTWSPMWPHTGEGLTLSFDVIWFLKMSHTFSANILDTVTDSSEPYCKSDRHPRHIFDLISGLWNRSKSNNTCSASEYEPHPVEGNGTSCWLTELCLANESSIFNESSLTLITDFFFSRKNGFTTKPPPPPKNKHFNVHVL